MLVVLCDRIGAVCRVSLMRARCAPEEFTDLQSRFWTFDLAAVKRVAVAGSSSIELRVEAFNLFNRTNFAPPNGNRSAAGFGTITAAYDPRRVQLGVKLLW